MFRTLLNVFATCGYYFRLQQRKEFHEQIPSKSEIASEGETIIMVAVISKEARISMKFQLSLQDE